MNHDVSTEAELQTALNTAASGDTITLLGTTFTLSTHIQGQAGTPVTLKTSFDSAPWFAITTGLNLEYLRFDDPVNPVNIHFYGGIEGGGIVSAEDAGPVSIGDLTQNRFVLIDISASGDILGGGVVGAQSDSGTAKIGALDGNTFSGTKIGADGIMGGSMIGAQSDSGTAEIGALDGNTFSAIMALMSSSILGGGVVGAQSSSGTAKIDTLSRNTFSTIKVQTFYDIEGGGMVGASGYNMTTLGDLTGNVFHDITITPNGSIYGGGMVGASGDDTATLGDLIGNAFTGDIVIAAGSRTVGGGVVGVSSYSNTASLGDLIGNAFTGFITMALGVVYGGGVVGASGSGTTTLGDLIGNDFTGNIHLGINDLIYGGGVVGALSSSGTAEIGALTGNHFTGIKATAEYDIQGGGIAGAFSENASATTSIGKISGNLFAGNDVASIHGSIHGGLIYARKLGEIVNSTFTGNTFEARNGRVFGAITLDTSSAGSDGTLSVRAENGGQTVFANNTTSDSLGDRPAESLYLGKLYGSSATHAQLDIDAQPGSRIDLADPIRVEQDGVYNVTMNVLGSGGEFRWGGKNVIDVTSAGSSVNFQAGSRTYLSEGFGLSGAAGTADVANASVKLESGAELRLPVPAVYDSATVPRMAVTTVDISGLVALDDRPLADVGLAEGDVVLFLQDSGSVIPNAPLGLGALTRGVSTQSYQLGWDTNNNVILSKLGAPVYNPGLGGSGPTTGTGAIAADTPVPKIARNHLQGFFWNRDKKTPGRQLWADTSFSRTRLHNGSRLNLSHRIETPALLAGSDIVATEDAMAGVAVGGSHPKYRSQNTQLDAEENILMAYGAASLPHDFELSGTLAASRVTYRHDRTVKDEAHKADYRGRNFLASLEIARPVELENGWALRPFVSQDYIRQKVDGYTEEGDGEFALTVKGQERELWVSRLGAGINWRGEEQTPGWHFSGGGEAYWQTLPGSTVTDAKVRFHNQKNPEQWYESRSERLPRHSLGLGLKANWTLRDRMNIRLGYDLRLSRRETTQEGSIKMEWNW